MACISGIVKLLLQFPFPVTLIFPQLRWQEVSLMCTETTSVIVSLSNLCETKRVFFPLFPEYFVFMHRRVLFFFFHRHVTEVKKHCIIVYFLSLQVIVFYHHPSAQGVSVMWPGSKIPAPWANTTNPSKLIQVGRHFQLKLYKKNEMT